jgi:hypothetical protein
MKDNEINFDECLSIVFLYSEDLPIGLRSIKKLEVTSEIKGSDKTCYNAGNYQTTHHWPRYKSYKSYL